jgi:hypothetical protein
MKKELVMLTLLGWYFITPPIAPPLTDEASAVANTAARNAPFKLWTVQSQFDTKEDCEHFSGTAAMSIGSTMKAEGRTTMNPVEASQAFGQCVEGDDPRFKQ